MSGERWFEVLLKILKTERAAETPKKRATQREAQRSQQVPLRTKVNLKNAAFDKDYDYRMHRNVVIGPMFVLTLLCIKISERNTRYECCSNGKVNMPPLVELGESQFLLMWLELLGSTNIFYSLFGITTHVFK
ncbi:hypothetical protein TNIN_374201 [Trichonephila inaurata madagascariensis]|uniref:Uncharacterized protein n=1 Tax=Trichonephila inaurata madagascariensis TaxID=2747483 RepID=A0A8X7CSG3_9ARAC|nr:hypothetical protein TNIN_374201 [Trichonephila inaurata madagascariensis]